jgi:hypothetical protein
MDMPGGGASPASGHCRTAYSLSTSRIFGTQTSTETRRPLINRSTSCGLRLRVKMTVPRTIGGTFDAIDCPNMWLSGSRFTNRSGRKGHAYLRYFATSRSTGTTLASTLR